MINEMKNINNRKARTDNGALTLNSTLDDCLDLYSLGGSCNDEWELKKLIEAALIEDMETALRVIAYLSDIRGGQGKRDLFKYAIKNISLFFSGKIDAEKFISLVPVYGRWDYLYEFVGTVFEKPAMEYMAKEAQHHIDNNTTGLVFKWMKSLSNHGVKNYNHDLAVLTRKYLNINEKKYRKLLKEKREMLGNAVVETKLSNKDYNSIDYSKVCSKASMIYREAFIRNDVERYGKFLNSVKYGDATINTNGIYPHELINKIKKSHGIINETIETLWNNLPDFLPKDRKILTVVDTSGSMTFNISKKSSVQAIDIAIGLGLYTSERLDSEYKDHVVTFSRNPQLIKVKGTSLYEKYRYINSFEWGMNTDIFKVFSLVLETAIKYNMKQEELPQYIMIVSDMEFDVCNENYNKTMFEVVTKLFEDNSYLLPKLIFWNVNSRIGNQPVKFDDRGAILVSGYSPAILKYILTGELESPLESMYNVINQKRYDMIADCIIK